MRAGPLKGPSGPKTKVCEEFASFKIACSARLANDAGACKKHPHTTTYCCWAGIELSPQTEQSATLTIQLYYHMMAKTKTQVI